VRFLNQSQVVNSRINESFSSLQPSRQLLTALLAELSDGGGEFASYCLNRLTEFSQSDTYLDSLIRDMTRSCPDVFNWNLASHAGGFSTAFSRRLAETRAGNVSFSFGMEMAGVIFRRSAFHASIVDRAGGEREQLLQVKII
jgi:hypothetical protein